MRFPRHLLLLGLGILLAACAGQAATPLPTAVPPSGPTGGDWAIGFVYEFPPSFWTEGEHRYAMVMSCPFIGPDPVEVGWNVFTVDANAPLAQSTVYLRAEGLTTEVFNPAYPAGQTINPAQRTTALLYAVGLSEEAVETAPETCEVLVLWDSAPVQPMTVQEPFRP